MAVIFGVSGAGKTTLGQMLAHDLGWSFYEADDFHSAANIEKMRNGIALTDHDRWPWLESLRALVERCITTGENAVLACSVLKESYRRVLRTNAEVKFIYLRGSYALIAERLRQRRGHFMDPDLLQSQFADLEEPKPTENFVTIDLNAGPARSRQNRDRRELVQEMKAKLHLDARRK